MASPNGVMSAMSIQPVNNAARQVSTQLTCYRFLAAARYTVSSYRLFATRIQSLVQYRLPGTWGTLPLFLDFSRREVVHSLVNGYTQFLCFTIWATTVPSARASQFGLSRHPALLCINIIPYGLPSTHRFLICHMRHLPNFNNGFSPCEY